MEAPGLSVGAVARRLGVSPSTLRTWDRRYGIGPSRRSQGSHRRYDPADVARLEVMNRLILQGAPPGEAARVALGGTGVRERAPRAHGAGGNRLALSAVPDRTRGLARAAMALNGPAVTETVREALARDGAVRAWEELIAPVLRGVGERYAATGEAVEIEHFLSGAALAALAEAASPVPETGVRPVLLACAPEEQHSLPVYALGAALAERGIPGLMLGARVPERALGDAMKRIGPGAVFVWSQMDRTGDAGVLERLPGGRSASRVLAGGPGWPRPLPEGVRFVASLPEAVAAVAEVLGLPG
ncbi:MerR family transcriptional regulator [Actinocorallia populi]|uniref:MerR family transcriptional regulator n=1 Tax=Actinocorallia populi TaxID=2079200 RepID=UPI0018E573EC|nr:MerR family transcriptional regulator [Actinocorallia populi]